MSDDWLQHGHESDGVELTPVLSSSSVPADRAGVLPTRRWASGWRGVLAGGALVVFATVGVVGVANALSDNLFPNIGSTRPASVWQNPVPATEPVPVTVVARTPLPTTTPIPGTTTTVTPSTVVAAPLSPTTSQPASRQRDVDDVDDVRDRGADDVAVTSTTAVDLDDDEPDDQADDRSGSSSGSGSNGSGSSGPSGRSGSDDSGSGDGGSGDSGSDDSGPDNSGSDDASDDG